MHFIVIVTIVYTILMFLSFYYGSYEIDDNNIHHFLYHEINSLGVNCDLNHIDVSNCEKFESIFSYKPNFNGNVSKWNVNWGVKLGSLKETFG